MRLKRLDIRGFGALRGTIPLETGEGTLSLLLERNEAGKSTLAAAVLAALYGVRSDRRRARSEKVEKDLYRPWQSGAYGLALTLEANDEELVVDRDLERGSVRVLRGSVDVTDRYQRGSVIAVGEELTGLTRDQFTLSTFVGQGDIIWSDAEGLTEALQRVADSQSGTATAATAIAALQQALDRYDGVTLANPGKVDTEIARCEKQIDDDRDALDALDRERAALADRIAAVTDRARQQRVHTLRREALRLRRLLREGAALQALLESDDRDRQRLQAHEAELSADSSWELLTSTLTEEVHRVRRERDMALRMVQRSEEEADAAETARRASAGALDELSLARRPTELDRDRLMQARHRIDDARRRRDQLERDLAAEQRALRARGVELDEARELAITFAEIHEDDRVLLSGRTRAVAHVQERRAELDQRASRQRHLIDDVESARRGRRRAALVLGGLGLVAAVAGHLLGGAIAAGVPAAAVYLPGALLLVAGVASLVMAGRHGRRDVIEARRQLDQLVDARREIDQEEIGIEGQWAALADRLGVEPEAIEPRYRRYRLVAGHVDALAVLTERIEEARHDEDVALLDAREAWTLFEGLPRADLLDERIDQVERALELHRQADSRATLVDQAQRKLDQHRALLRRHDRALLGLLEDAGVEVPPTGDLTEALRELDTRVERARKLRQVRDEVMPDLQSRLLDDERRQAQVERLEQIRAEQVTLRADLESSVGLLGDDADRVRAELDRPLTQREYDEALAALEGEEEQRRRHGEEERTSARAFLQRYELEGPRLRDSLGRHERALRKARQFRESVLLARDTLDEISRQTHRSWAAALNRYANEILSALGSQVQSLSFDESLGLRMVQKGQTLTGRDAVQHLSAGAADAVYLAARIAVSRFLSGGREPLPLVLDDPFANADDHRLSAGVRLLLEVIAPRQQVLLMACQHSRYEWLRQELGHPGALVTLSVDEDERGEGVSDTEVRRVAD